MKIELVGNMRSMVLDRSYTDVQVLSNQGVDTENRGDISDRMRSDILTVFRRA